MPGFIWWLWFTDALIIDIKIAMRTFFNSSDITGIPILHDPGINARNI